MDVSFFGKEVSAGEIVKDLDMERLSWIFQVDPERQVKCSYKKRQRQLQLTLQERRRQGEDGVEGSEDAGL